MKIICVGHSAYDVTLPVDKFPEENTKQQISQVIECGGGSASNGACLLKKWQEDVYLYSVVGNDYYGKKILKEYKNIDLKTKYIESRNNYLTNRSYIMANTSNGTRTIITDTSSKTKQVNKKIVKNADIILIDGVHADTAKKAIEANPSAIKILDAGKVTQDTKILGKMVDYLICSLPFAEDFTNIKININNMKTLITCYEKLQDFFKTNIIITLDKDGCFTKTDDYKLFPTLKVATIDSTGAGDIFHGAFAYFVGKGYNLEDTIKYSSITAALSTKKIGSRFSIPTLKEVMKYDKSL